MNQPIKKTLDYPLDSRLSITPGMTLCTDDGKMKVIEYLGSAVFHENAAGKPEEGYAPKQLPDAPEWRRYTLIVEKE